MREQGLLTLQYPSGLLRLSREDKRLPATHHIASYLTDLSNLSSQRPHSLYTSKAKLITLPRKPALSSFLSWSPRFRCSFSLLATTYVLPKPAVYLPSKKAPLPSQSHYPQPRSDSSDLSSELFPYWPTWALCHQTSSLSAHLPFSNYFLKKLADS